MSTLALVLFMLKLSPAPDEGALRHRVALASAIAVTDATEHEQRLLASIARWESAYLESVADCRHTGDAGKALGAWQIHPRNDAERKDACTLDAGARLALARVRESIQACSYLPEQERLAVFASGSCGNRGGRAASRRRWVE
jgi:hypothetical protein